MESASCVCRTKKCPPPAHVFCGHAYVLSHLFGLIIFAGPGAHLGLTGRGFVGTTVCAGSGPVGEGDAVMSKRPGSGRPSARGIVAEDPPAGDCVDGRVRRLATRRFKQRYEYAESLDSRCSGDVASRNPPPSPVWARMVADGQCPYRRPGLVISPCSLGLTGAHHELSAGGYFSIRRLSRSAYYSTVALVKVLQSFAQDHACP